MKKTGKTWKDFEFLTILRCSIVKFDLTQKFYHINKIFCHHQKMFLLKNAFKVTLQYPFNVFILFNPVSYIKLNFKLKIDPKICSFKKP